MIPVKIISTNISTCWKYYAYGTKNSQHEEAVYFIEVDRPDLLRDQPMGIFGKETSAEISCKFTRN